MLFNQSHARKETLPSMYLLQRIDEFMWEKAFNILLFLCISIFVSVFC